MGLLAYIFSNYILGRYHIRCCLRTIITQANVTTIESNGHGGESWIEWSLLWPHHHHHHHQGIFFHLLQSITKANVGIWKYCMLYIYSTLHFEYHKEYICLYCDCDSIVW